MSRPLSTPLDDLLAEGGSYVRRLVGRLRAVDRELARGDAVAAVAWADSPEVWGARDLQAAARLCEAWLRCEDPEPARLLRKRYVMAWFLEGAHPRAGARNLSLGSASWPRARLEDLARRARDWLRAPASERT